MTSVMGMSVAPCASVLWFGLRPQAGLQGQFCKLFSPPPPSTAAWTFHKGTCLCPKPQPSPPRELLLFPKISLANVSSYFSRRHPKPGVQGSRCCYCADIVHGWPACPRPCPLSPRASNLPLPCRLRAFESCGVGRAGSPPNVHLVLALAPVSPCILVPPLLTLDLG